MNSKYLLIHFFQGQPRKWRPPALMIVRPPRSSQSRHARGGRGRPPSREVDCRNLKSSQLSFGSLWIGIKQVRMRLCSLSTNRIRNNLKERGFFTIQTLDYIFFIIHNEKIQYIILYGRFINRNKYFCPAFS